MELLWVVNLLASTFFGCSGRSVIARSARVQQSVNPRLFLQGYNSFPAFYFGANESGLVTCRRTNCCEHLSLDHWSDRRWRNGRTTFCIPSLREVLCPLKFPCDSLSIIVYIFFAFLSPWHSLNLCRVVWCSVMCGNVAMWQCGNVAMCGRTLKENSSWLPFVAQHQVAGWGWQQNFHSVGQDRCGLGFPCSFPSPVRWHFRLLQVALLPARGSYAILHTFNMIYLMIFAWIRPISARWLGSLHVICLFAVFTGETFDRCPWLRWLREWRPTWRWHLQAHRSACRLWVTACCSCILQVILHWYRRLLKERLL